MESWHALIVTLRLTVPQGAQRYGRGWAGGGGEGGGLERDGISARKATTFVIVATRQDRTRSKVLWYTSAAAHWIAEQSLVYGVPTKKKRSQAELVQNLSTDSGHDRSHWSCIVLVSQSAVCMQTDGLVRLLYRAANSGARFRCIFNGRDTRSSPPIQEVLWQGG